MDYLNAVESMKLDHFVGYPVLGISSPLHPSKEKWTWAIILEKIVFRNYDPDLPKPTVVDNLFIGSIESHPDREILHLYRAERDEVAQITLTPGLYTIAKDVAAWSETAVSPLEAEED